MRNGKGNLPITERARRVYSPSKPSRAEDNAEKGIYFSSIWFWLNNNSHRFLSSAAGKDMPQSEQESDDQDEYNPYLEQEQQSLMTSEMSDSGAPMVGLRLDNIEFEEQNLFDNFKPLFDYTAPSTAAFLAEKSEDSVSVDEGKTRSKYGKGIKLGMNIEQSVDLLF